MFCFCFFCMVFFFFCIESALLPPDMESLVSFPKSSLRSHPFLQGIVNVSSFDSLLIIFAYFTLVKYKNAVGQIPICLHAKFYLTHFVLVTRLGMACQVYLYSAFPEVLQMNLGYEYSCNVIFQFYYF